MKNFILQQISRKLICSLFCTLILASAALAVAYRCTPCSQNYYCQAGVSYECPPETPVTISTGAKSATECVTCAQRDGESYPAYDDIAGKCVACWQIPATTTPYYNSTTGNCEPCPENTTWNSEELSCKESGPQAAFTIPHNDGFIYIMQSAAPEEYKSISPKSTAEETADFLASYGISHAATLAYWPDYWAGAMKYCQDQGLRLPTMEETISILNSIYNTNKICNTACTDSLQTGCCDYYGSESLTVSNQQLLNFICTNSSETNGDAGCNIWTSAEKSSTHAFLRSYNLNTSNGDDISRYYTLSRALCVK